jgi:outer membrane protein assembly factor BamB/tetratricopeptide (TPR) repeat protein
MVKRWGFREGGLYPAPTLQGSTLYVSSAEGLHAVAVEDGSERWAVETRTKVQSSAPVVDGTVYFLAGDSLRAHDAATGQQEWTVSFDAEPVSVPVVDDGTVYVGTEYGSLYALSASDGEQQWTRGLDNRIPAPAVVNETLYVGTYSGRVYAVDLQTRDTIWSTRIGGAVYTPVAVVNSTVYIGDSEGALHAVSATDGTSEWSAEVEVSSSGYVSAPAVANGAVYLTTTQRLYAFSAGDGSEQWRFETGGQDAPDPAVVDDTVYVGGKKLYALAADSGDMLGSFDAGEEVTSPIVGGGNVYVCSNSRYRPGTLYALTGGAKPVITGRQETRRGQDVTFTGRESTTTADSIVSYEWTFDGLIESTATGPEVTHTFWDTGEQTVELRVTDNEGQATTTSTSIQVLTNPAFFPYKAGAAAVTGVGLLGIGSARWFFQGYRQVTDPTDESENSVDTLLEAANAAQDDADAVDPAENLGEAIDAYEMAAEHYQTVLEELPEDADRRKEVSNTLESIESALQGLRQQRETESELIEKLRTAEGHFQTAIAAPTSDRVIIPRERYRQARDGYDEALELYDELDEPPETLTVSPDVDIASPPETLSAFPGVTPAATEYFEERGLDTLSALRDADAGTIEDFRSAEAIHEKLAVRLVGLRHWLGDETITLEGREDIEQRKELAADGYRVHR